MVIVSSVFFSYVFLFCAFGGLPCDFPASSLVSLGTYQSSSGSAALLRSPLDLPVLSFASLQSWSSLLRVLYSVWSACGISFSFGALVRGVDMQMPFAFFCLCLSLLLLLVAASVVGRLLSYSMIPSFCYCRYFGVSIPSPCVSVSLGSVPLFRSGLVFFFGFWSICSSLITRCLLPCSLLCGTTSFCITSASFGSLVPFATWSPFGMSQGLLRPLSLSVLGGSFHVVVSLLYSVSVPFFL